jgi:hypothetical protein
MAFIVMITVMLEVAVSSYIKLTQANLTFKNSESFKLCIFITYSNPSSFMNGDCIPKQLIIINVYQGRLHTFFVAKP